MIAFPSMLIEPAKTAGMKVPNDPDDYDAEYFPHFDVFIKYQLGRRMPAPSSHWNNAKIIAAIPDDEIKKVTLGKLAELGVS